MGVLDPQRPRTFAVQLIKVYSGLHLRTSSGPLATSWSDHHQNTQQGYGFSGISVLVEDPGRTLVLWSLLGPLWLLSSAVQLVKVYSGLHLLSSSVPLVTS